MQNYKILVFLPILAISACKSSSSEWSCRNLNSKVGCASIAKADEAYLENGKFSPTNTTQSFPSKSPSKYSSFEDVNLGQSRLVRSPEKIGRIWIAPYMDGKGNYHEDSFIRVVDSESKWEKIPASSDEKSTLQKNSTTAEDEQTQDLSNILESEDNLDDMEEIKNEVGPVTKKY